MEKENLSLQKSRTQFICRGAPTCALNRWA